MAPAACELFCLGSHLSARQPAGVLTAIDNNMLAGDIVDECQQLGEAKKCYCKGPLVIHLGGLALHEPSRNRDTSPGLPDAETSLEYLNRLHP